MKKGANKMVSRKILLALGLTLVVMASCLASANAYNILLLAADDTSNQGVKTYLVGTGLFTDSDVTYYDARAASPTLSELNAYDAVMVWTNHAAADPVALGNVLADYVDAGGGVVLAAHCFHQSIFLGGRIMTNAAYSPFPAGTSQAWVVNPMGWYDAASPIMSGVTSMSTQIRNIVSLRPEATAVANWEDGSPLAAYAHGGQIVGITFPPIEDNVLRSSVLTGDYARLIANALIFTVDAVSPSYSSLKGKVTLTGYTGDKASVGVKVELTGTSVRTEYVLLDAEGNYTVNDVLSGDYTVAFKSPQFLKKVVQNVTIPPAGPGVCDVTLAVGSDVDGDNSVTTTDLSVVLTNLGATGE